jgi:hypothetical protein
MKDNGMKKLYICGRVIGDANYQRKFKDAEAELRAAGFRNIANPARLVPPETGWRTAMRMCLKALLDCDGLAVLPDWNESRGAKLEIRIASELGIEIKPHQEWIS